LIYYRHFYQIVENGRSMAVIIQHTERKVVGKSTQKNRMKIYQYRAVFQFRNQERAMPITPENYEQLKSGTPVPVLYDESLDDFMPTNYPADHRQLITPLIFWILLGGILGHGFWAGRQRKAFSGSSFGKRSGDRLQRNAAQFVKTV
jgi:hypothetical protein